MVNLPDTSLKTHSEINSKRETVDDMTRGRPEIILHSLSWPIPTLSNPDPSGYRTRDMHGADIQARSDVMVMVLVLYQIFFA